MTCLTFIVDFVNFLIAVTPDWCSFLGLLRTQQKRKVLLFRDEVPKVKNQLKISRIGLRQIAVDLFGLYVADEPLAELQIDIVDCTASGA